MNLNYEEYLRRELNILKNDMELDSYDLVVDTEQSFIKRKDLSPRTIYVLIKYNTSTIQLGAIIQPIQIMILSEQNTLEQTRALFTSFAQTHNWLQFNYDYVVEENNSEVTLTGTLKQQYSTPVVLSNFNEVQYGYRSVLYISATLFIAENFADLSTLKIDDENITASSFVITYAMTPNTQQIRQSNAFISTSVKNISSLAITFSIPVIQSTFLTKVLSIINETDSQTESGSVLYGGNEDFTFDFYIGNVHFENKKLKLTSATFTTLPTGLPGLELGFLK